LSYVDNIKPSLPKQVEYGKWIHKELDRWVRGEPPHPEVLPFVDALERWLEMVNQKIEQSEHEFKVWYKDYCFHGVIDALTPQYALEYKITTFPQRYQRRVDYQTALYSYYIQHHSKQLIYLLFEVKGQNFQKLHIEYPVISPVIIQQRLDEMVKVCDLIKSCYETGNFPPNFKSCPNCFFKEVCGEYYEI